MLFRNTLGLYVAKRSIPGHTTWNDWEQKTVATIDHLESYAKFLSMIFIPPPPKTH